MAALASTPRIMINMSQTSLNLDMTRSVSCALKWLLRKFLSSPKKSLSISLLAPSPSFLIERWILLPSTIWYSCKCDESKNKKYITRKIILLAFNYVNSDLFSNLRKPWIHQRAAAEDPSKGYISACPKLSIEVMVKLVSYQPHIMGKMETGKEVYPF